MAPPQDRSFASDTRPRLLRESVPKRECTADDGGRDNTCRPSPWETQRSFTGERGRQTEPTAAKLTQNHFDYRRHIECTRSICEEQIDYRAMKGAHYQSPLARVRIVECCRFHSKAYIDLLRLIVAHHIVVLVYAA